MKTRILLQLLFCSFSILILASFAIPEQVHVSGNVAWTKTSYVINVGDRLEIISNGEISPLANLNCNPSGIANLNLQKKFSVLKSENFGCLIGRIGENGKSFVVGEHLNIIADSNGIIYLGINDSDLKDNKGEFRSSVIIIVKSQESTTDSISN